MYRLHVYLFIKLGGKISIGTANKRQRLVYLVHDKTTLYLHLFFTYNPLPLYVKQALLHRAVLTAYITCHFDLQNDCFTFPVAFALVG